MENNGHNVQSGYFVLVGTSSSRIFGTITLYPSYIYLACLSARQRETELNKQLPLLGSTKHQTLTNNLRG